MRGFNTTKALTTVFTKEYVRDPLTPPGFRIPKPKSSPCVIQPFGHKLFKSIACFHEQFLNRTVMVQDNDVDSSMRLLNRLLGKENILGIMRRAKYYEKPFEQRNRLGFEFCTGIYHEDMQRKVTFVLRKNRAEPYPGTL